jgi:hypothetical protein
LRGSLAFRAPDSKSILGADRRFGYKIPPIMKNRYSAVEKTLRGHAQKPNIEPRAVVIATLLAAAVAVLPGAGRAREHGLAARGLAIAPIPLNLQHKDRNLVGLGSYLANAVAGCVDCHTFPEYEPGGNPFLGQPERINRKNYLAGGRCFGPLMSTNITPDSKGLPGGLTWARFRAMIRTGKLSGTHGTKAGLGRVMPWPMYARMTDHDLRAIYEYLSAVPHAKPSNSSCPPVAPH